jgi:hypothetical protein
MTLYIPAEAYYDRGLRIGSAEVEDVGRQQSSKLHFFLRAILIESMVFDTPDLREELGGCWMHYLFG